jgi:hypothetical protein
MKEKFFASGASGGDMLIEAIKAASFANPMDTVIHNKILERLKIFLVIGGMPRVVNTYINEKNLAACPGGTDQFKKI